MNNHQIDLEVATTINDTALFQTLPPEIDTSSPTNM